MQVYFWLSIVMGVFFVILLLVGERTLPFFGGDKELAGLVYKTITMPIVTCAMSWPVYRMFSGFSEFLSWRLKEAENMTGLHQTWRNFLISIDAVTIFSKMAVFAPAALIVASLVISVVIWKTE